MLLDIEEMPNENSLLDISLDAYGNRRFDEVNDKVYAYYFLETKLPNNQNFLVNLQFSRWDK